MAIQVYEKQNGRRRKVGLKPSLVIDLIITRDTLAPGEDEPWPNYDDVIEAVNAFLPSTIMDEFTGVQMNLSEISIVDQLVDGRDVCPSIYLGQFQYNSDEVSKPPGGNTYNFEAIAGQQKIYRSLATVHKYAASGTAPDFGGAIGVNGTGEVEGVEIYVPTYKFSETWIVPQAFVNDAYKNALFVTEGTVNQSSFRHLDEGECLYLGARGSTRNDGHYEITFDFLASPNVTGLTIGAITGIEKKGWEYLWVYTEKTPVGSGADAAMCPTAKYAYVEKVYYESSFSALGIGS